MHRIFFEVLSILQKGLKATKEYDGSVMCGSVQLWDPDTMKLVYSSAK